MKNFCKVFISVFVFFIFNFLFIHTYNAESYFDFDLENYKYATKIEASELSKFFNSFSNENLNAIKSYFDSNYKDNGGMPYVLWNACRADMSDCNLILVKFKEKASYLTRNSNGLAGFNLTDRFIDEFYYFDFDKDSNSITLTEDPVYSFGSLYFYNALPYYFCFPLWTSRDIYWSDLIDFESWQLTDYKTIYYVDDYSSFDEKYKSYYNFIPFESSSYVYTLIDLVGINTTKPSNIYTYVDYEIRYYFDNELDPGKTIKGSGKVGDEISKYTDYSDDNYYLIEDDYSIRLVEGRDNFLNIYFKSYKTYKIEYYFDDKLREDYVEYKKGKVGDVITEFTDYSDNDYKLYGEDYSFTIYEDDNQNIFRIYYRSKNYGAGASYEQIDTRNSKIPFIFHYDDIKSFLTGIDFNSFTQSEQLLITIIVNVWFIGFFSFITWLFLKLVYKVFQLF